MTIGIQNILNKVKALFKRKRQITIEYNALQESLKRMSAFEQKYGISSLDIYSGNYSKVEFENSDKYLWESYIRTFIRCGGCL